jgi:hypothetical protein
MNDVITKATAALAESVGLIIGSDYDDATRAAELAETFSEFEAYLEKANDDGGGSEDDSVGRVDHHASTVADLLTEAGTFPHRTAASLPVEQTRRASTPGAPAQGGKNSRKGKTYHYGHTDRANRNYEEWRRPGIFVQGNRGPRAIAL